MLKSVLKCLYELFLAFMTRRSLGSTFRRRLKFIRCDHYAQEIIKRKLNITTEDSDRKES